MMKIHKRVFFGVAAVLAVLLSFQTARAGTIIKLSLGNDAAPDVEYVGGVFSTIDDLIPSPGEQNTAVEFLGFLNSIPNIAAADASYTIDGVTKVPGPAAEFGGVIQQDLTGGTFQLWDDDGVTLLLGVALGNSRLFGNNGPPGAGAVFSTSFGTPLGGAAGGTLASLIAPGTISFSIGMTNINNGLGLSLAGPFSVFGPVTFGTLNDFSADVTKSIDAEQVPEPAAALLLVIGGLMAPTVLRRRR